MTIHIHPISTGRVALRPSQERRGPLGPLGVLLDRGWTEWRPIFAWLIDHPEGPILVDTGETAAVMRPGYLPRWHPFFRLSVRFDITPEQEIGPRLRALGYAPGDLRCVVLTHLHTDHAGGLAHVAGCPTLVSLDELAAARGPAGRLRGYLPHRWPSDFSPQPIGFAPMALGPFQEGLALTRAGDVVVVPTPGHTRGHVSVVVRRDGLNILIAGDTSYAEQGLREGVAGGVTSTPALEIATLASIRRWAEAEPVVYLPSHDPEAPARLAASRPVFPR